MSFRHLPILALALALGAALLLGGCGDEDQTYSIDEVREKPGTSGTAAGGQPVASADERFGRSAHGGGMAASSQRKWKYELPEGWTKLPPKPLREFGLQVAGDPNTEVTFSILQGDGGGLAMNVNRWRKQMSLPPISAEELEALPEKGSLLKAPATLVELEGKYVGMRGEKNIENAKMRGLIVVVPQRGSFFLKMTGPASVVDAEIDGFDQVAATLVPDLSAQRMPPGHGQRMPPGHGQRPTETPPGHGQRSAPPSRLAWSAHDSWKKQGPRMMREVTYKTPKGAEVWVSLLGGQAGGLLENVNRWRGQMKQPPIAEADIAKLPRLEAMGKDGVLVFVEGEFGSGGMGMGGPDQLENAALMAFALMRENDSVFVKMIGPAEAVLAEKDNFEAFCRSLKANK